MAPFKPIGIYRVDLATSMALGINVVKFFDSCGSEAKAREVVIACTFEVFIVRLRGPFMC